jgi:Flp pilus assembly protein protease CpaA
MDPAQLLLLLVLGAALGASLAADVAERRIPDLVTFPAFAAGLALRAVAGAGGPGGLLAGLAGAAVAGAPFLLVWARGGMGLGDVKLMAVVGMALGPRGATAAVLLVGVAGAIQALLAMARAGGLVHGLQRCAALLGLRGASGLPPAVQVPYGVSICAGSVLAALLG